MLTCTGDQTGTCCTIMYWSNPCLHCKTHPYQSSPHRSEWVVQHHGLSLGRRRQSCDQSCPAQWRRSTGERRGDRRDQSGITAAAKVVILSRSLDSGHVEKYWSPNNRSVCRDPAGAVSYCANCGILTRICTKTTL